MEISSKLVSELRSKTGSGILDCKKALEESSGDIEKAVEWLRIKGIASAQKRSDRQAGDGLVGVICDDNGGLLIELNCETDFVAKSEEFCAFMKNLMNAAIKDSSITSLEQLSQMHCDFANDTVSGAIIKLASTCGENMVLRRMKRIDGKNVFSYNHGQIFHENNVSLGKNGVLISFESDVDREKLSTIGKDIGMHIAFSMPKFLSSKNVTDDVISLEKRILTDQARESGTAEEMLEKVIAGKIKKFVSSISLEEQPFVKDTKKTVKTIIDDFSKEIGSDISINEFIVFPLGA